MKSESVHLLYVLIDCFGSVRYEGVFQARSLRAFFNSFLPESSFEVDPDAVPAIVDQSCLLQHWYATKHSLQFVIHFYFPLLLLMSSLDKYTILLLLLDKYTIHFVDVFVG